MIALNRKLIAVRTLQTLAVILACATLYWSYLVFTEVPNGYRRIDFRRDLCADIPSAVSALEGQRVFLKGVMYPEVNTTGIREFLLLRKNFYIGNGDVPKNCEMARIRLKSDATTEWTWERLSVWGVLRVHPTTNPGEPLFTIEDADIEPSRTAF